MQHDTTRVAAALCAIGAVPDINVLTYGGSQEDEYRRALDLIDSQGVIVEIGVDGDRERIVMDDGPRRLALYGPPGVRVWAATPVDQLAARRLEREATAARVGGGLGA